VLQVPIVDRDVEAGTVSYDDPETGERTTVPVTGGHCKLQWKADWAMRWVALGIDYEMSGKDLIDSVKLSSRIAKVLGGTPPEGFNYELFLDADGTKISKSKGNGLAADDWLTYAPQESLALFMYHQPKKAKKLHFDVIPRFVDDYLTHLGKFPQQAPEEQVDNPVWHIHEGRVPEGRREISFAVLLNLAAVVNADDKSLLWGFITRYLPGASPESAPFLDALAGFAVRYYQDFVKPAKRYRAPTPPERAALFDLAGELKRLPAGADGETIQTQVYEVGKRHLSAQGEGETGQGFASLRDWFRALYEILLGQSQGPRFGSFAALYGLSETIALIERVLDGADLNAGQG
jgi:lysyl-tRNA synthetase class 1